MTNNTQRQRSEEALLASELRYRRLFESAQDGILILDAETGMVVDVNPFLIKMLGFSHEQFLGKKLWELGFFKDIVANQDNFAELQQKEYIRYENKPLETADGRRIDVEFVSNVYEVDHHKVIQCNIRDISERKRAEATLRGSEKRFRSLAVATSQIIWSTDGQGQVCEPMPSFQDYTGQSDEETRGAGWVSALHPDDVERTVKVWKEAVEAKAGYLTEYRLRRHDGVYRHFTARGAPVLADDGRILEWIGTCTDITERKLAESSLRESEERLEQERVALEVQLRQQQKLESIGTLAGGVAHEINNPINGIMNYAQLIQDQLPAGSPLAEFTAEILRETQRVATIVRNLLTFARNEKQSHSPARLVDIVEGTLSLMRTVIRRDQITLRVNVPEDLPDLSCRTQQIQQVLMNLMTNARDALNERYPGHDPDKVLNLDARLFEKEGRRWIRVTVEDHGTGITPKVRERMFDPFFTTKSRDQGTGLGLAISHGIVKEHHGELTVESEPGRFTRMHLDLPI